ncbi:choice-of-anchor M domain-containing protein [Streptomyces solisilvae]|uniref:choice-of-anchor M domain-containing protein n=1 Tax=Streptomyces malaysiensis TaxID=92644 RepID=UPI00367CE4A6
MGSLTHCACVVGALGLTLSGLVVTGGEAAGADRTPSAVRSAALAASADDVLSDRIVIDQGHVDAVAPRMADGEFRTLFRDSRTSDVVWREPGSVIMHLTDKSKQVVPDPAGGSAFIGEAGQVYYSIPQTQDPAILWAGWSTEAFSTSSVQGQLSFSLDKVEGPGGLLIFNWSPFGEPLMRFDSRDGLPDTYAVSAVTHEHANWVFTEQGVYRLTFTVSATLASGEEVSDSQTYTMAVGDIDPDDVSLPGDSGGDTGGGDSGGDSGGGSGGDASGGSDGGSGGGTGGDQGGNTGGDSGGGSGGGQGGDGGDASGGGSGSGSGGGTGGDQGGNTGGDSGGDSGGGQGGDGGEESGVGGSEGSAGGGSGGGLGADAGTGNGTAGIGDSELARTGADMTVPLGAGGAALLAGAGALYLSRRRPRGAERR